MFIPANHPDLAGRKINSPVEIEFPFCERNKIVQHRPTEMSALPGGKFIHREKSVQPEKIH